MLGLSGIGVPLGFILCLISAVLCVAYGAMNWNKGYIKDEEIELENVWGTEEKKIEEIL